MPLEARTAQTQIRQPVASLVLGTIEWFLFVAVPGRSDPNVSGRWYVLAVLGTALVFGALFRDRQKLRAGLLLITPALVFAWWTVPAGDNSGLQMLWFLFLPLVGLLASAFYVVGSSVRRRLQNVTE